MSVYMNSFNIKHYGNDIVAYNKSLFTEFPISLFDPNYLAKNSLLHIDQMSLSDSMGRGRVHAFKYKEYDLVLRHYYRGGHVSKFLNDAYFWKSLNKTRAMSELNLLSTMQKLHLPVPLPVASHINRVGVLYKADIVTQLIPSSQSISSKLMKDIIPVEVWHEIGLVIRQFHNHNINHADLNAHNILLDFKNRIYLVDFDKSKIEESPGGWCGQNIARLERSFTKLKESENKFNYTDNDFQFLLEGYNNG